MFSTRWASPSDGNIENKSIGDSINHLTDPRVLQIKIPDIQPTPFCSFLKFLYTEELDTTVGHVAQLMYTSRKYQVDELSEACIKFVRDNIDSSNALLLLADAKKFLDPVLEQIGFDFISRNAYEVVTSESFLSISQEVLAYLLERKDLHVDEVLLFNNIWRWSQNECARKLMEPNNTNCRLVLGSALTSIRFLQMNAEDFVTNVAKLKIFTVEEEIEILRHITLPEALKQAPQTEFMKSLTQWPRKNRFTVTRVLKSEPRLIWPHDDEDEDDQTPSSNQCFSINRPAALVSCGFFGPFEKLVNGTPTPASYTVCLSLKNWDCDFTYASVVKTAVIEPKLGEDIFHVPFVNPVSLTPGVWYTINFTIHGPPSLSGNGEPKNAVTFGDRDLVLVKFKEAKTDNSINQLPELCFEV